MPIMCFLRGTHPDLSVVKHHFFLVTNKWSSFVASNERAFVPWEREKLSRGELVYSDVAFATRTVLKAVMLAQTGVIFSKKK